MHQEECSSALDWEYLQFIFLNVFPLLWGACVREMQVKAGMVK